jgi:WD40 repeat protein
VDTCLKDSDGVVETSRPPLLGHTNEVNVMAIAADSNAKRMVTGGKDGLVLLWDTEDNPIALAPNHSPSATVKAVDATSLEIKAACN